MSKNDAWHVARTQPQKEALASVHLARQGIATYCPTFSRTVRKGSRFIERSQPLFPGYLFVAPTDDPALWRQISSTRGIAYLVGYGRSGSPACVPPDVMNELRSHFDNGHLPALMPRFAIGDTVEVERGPLSGLSARIIGLDARGRVDLLLDLLGGVSATLDADQLRAA